MLVYLNPPNGLLAYSKAKWKSNGNKAFPCFKPFLIGNMSGKCLLTVLQVLFGHIFY